MLNKYFTDSIIKLGTFSFILFRASYTLFRSFNGAYLDFTIQSFKCPGGSLVTDRSIHDWTLKVHLRYRYRGIHCVGRNLHCSLI